MCNIAGYIGEREAAPILIDMIRAQEGLNGGFYTGIATLHKGKIHYRKVVGDLETLLKRTDAASLPGNIGIIHSRTPGDQGDEWAHPFVCERDGEVFTAHVYNGSVGHFDYIDEKRARVAEKLIKEGFSMRSHVFGSNGKRVTLSDNSRVHISDIMCQLISQKMLQGERSDIAMENGFCEIPAEIVGLMLSANDPDAIVFARINMPMHAGFADHGTYLASAPQAFPNDKKGEPYLLPAFSKGYIKKNGISLSLFEKAPATLAPLSASLMSESYAAVSKALRESKRTMPELAKLIKPLFDEADCLQAACAVYKILDDLKQKNLLKIERGTRPGVFEGLSAPVFYLYI